MEMARERIELWNTNITLQAEKRAMQTEIAALREDFEEMRAWRDTHLQRFLSHSDRLLGGGGGGGEHAELIKEGGGVGQREAAGAREDGGWNRSNGDGGGGGGEAAAAAAAAAAAVSAPEGGGGGGGGGGWRGGEVSGLQARTGSSSQLVSSSSHSTPAAGHRGQEIVPKLDLTPVTSPSISPTQSLVAPAPAPAQHAQPLPLEPPGLSRDWGGARHSRGSEQHAGGSGAQDEVRCVLPAAAEPVMASSLDSRFRQLDSKLSLLQGLAGGPRLVQPADMQQRRGATSVNEHPGEVGSGKMRAGSVGAAASHSKGGLVLLRDALSPKQKVVLDELEALVEKHHEVSALNPADVEKPAPLRYHAASIP